MKLIKLIEGLILFWVDFLKEGATLPQRLELLIENLLMLTTNIHQSE